MLKMGKRRQAAARFYSSNKSLHADAKQRRCLAQAEKETARLPET
jgi:hypothetical protein